MQANELYEFYLHSASSIQATVLMPLNTNPSCFHCGLPVLSKRPPTFQIDTTTHAFCCHGCHSICQAIIQSGNKDYYRYREGTNKTADTEDLPDLLKRLKLYDKTEIQRTFVRTDKNNDWKEAWLILEEIRCAACLWLNERTLRQLDGVLEVQMDYTGQQARVRWQPDKIKLSEILTAISNIGYIAHPFDAKHREALNKEQQQRSIKRIVFAVIFGMMVMQTAVSSYFFGASNEQGDYPLWITISRWSSLTATGFILLYSGQLFFRHAWRDLKNKTLGMDVPIALGLLVAWLGSLHSTVTGQGEVYYESIAMFVLLILIARFIELRARIDATALLDRTVKIIPATARRISNDSHHSLEEVAVIELQVGDRIQLSPGETVPVDAVLQSTVSHFDEALLSGESLPVKHSKGEHIMGGSINIDQPITLEVCSNSAHSTLSKMQQLTQQSVNDKPYYVDLAESVAGKFVATILFIATATLLYWLWVAPQYAIGHMVAVLIVTCPCALALAAPVSLSLCAAGLSRLQVMTVRMSAIEEMSHIDTLVFDKTGTLTQGKPQLASIIALGKQSKDRYLALAASMEQQSEHPFAKALRDAASGLTHVSLEKRLNHLGKGIEATLKGTQWKLGSEAFAGGESSLQDQQRLNTLREQGFSLLYLSNTLDLQAIFCIHDPLREGIEAFLAELSADKQCVILSGDHPQSVTAMAKSLGITESYGGMSPEDKLQWIKQRQQQGHAILMLGDGINDAPTLAAANVSLAFNDATDLAQSQCDLMILRKDYKHLASAFSLMKKTRTIILQNLGWAIAYNLLAIPAAAMGLVTPWMAAIGMSLSSFVVVLNSLRLRKMT